MKRKVFGAMSSASVACTAGLFLMCFLLLSCATTFPGLKEANKAGTREQKKAYEETGKWLSTFRWDSEPFQQENAVKVLTDNPRKWCAVVEEVKQTVGNYKYQIDAQVFDPAFVSTQVIIFQTNNQELATVTKPHSFFMGENKGAVRYEWRRPPNQGEHPVLYIYVSID